MLDRHTHYFLAVAEHHGFTRAAAALHVSQPALSQQIRQLEEALGVQVFDRSGRLTRLTDAGEVYLRYARSALQALEEGKRAIHDVEALSRGGPARRGDAYIYRLVYRPVTGQILYPLS